MAKPIIKPIPAFDSSLKSSIGFVWSGNTAYNNRLVIYDADTQRIVYDHEYSENYYALNHEIPANTLQNNHKYAAQIEVIDVNGVRSASSDKAYFWTAVAPHIIITNLRDGDVINSSSVTVEATYDNTLTEDLLFVRYHLYDSNKKPLKETDEDRTCSLTYTFKALENNTTYFIRITGLTIHEMEVDTGYIEVNISYRNPNSYARIYAENDPRTGFIHYKSNIVVISPDLNNFNYDVGYIDLSDTESGQAFEIKTNHDVHSELSVYYTDDEGQQKYVTTAMSDDGLVISNYRRINKVRLYGVTTSKAAIDFEEFNPLISLKQVVFVVNDEPVTHQFGGFELRSLPKTASDYYEVDDNGSRQIVVSVGQHRFTARDKAILTDVENGNFVTYYDFGGKIGGLADDLYADGIPVCVDNQTSISLDPTTGYIKIIWRSDSGITEEDEVQSFFSEQSPCVLFPLQEISTYKLDNQPIPKMTNQTFLRYSKNFVIPWDASAFVFKMKQCRKSADVFKVSKDGRTCFIVSTMVNEDDEFRLKLTVFGEGGSNYTQYSDAISIDYLSVLYVAIKRDNGIYGMYITPDVSDEQTAGMWLMSQPPTYNLSPYDTWIDMDGDSVYVDTTTKTAIYQHNEPDDDIEQYTVWIGDEV